MAQSQSRPKGSREAHHTRQTQRRNLQKEGSSHVLRKSSPSSSSFPRNPNPKSLLFIHYARITTINQVTNRPSSLHPPRPQLLLPKLFGEFRQRYANRPGGYTRVLRVEPKKEDQAPSAI